MKSTQVRWFRELSLTVAGCFLVLLILWGYDTWASHRSASEAASPSKPLVQSGSPIGVKGVDFGKSPVTLVLVSSPTCKYCLASAHFHSKLMQVASENHIPFYVAIPSRKAASKYLQELDARNDRVGEYSQMTVSVSGTPTIIGVDNNGRVRALWSGLATPADEKEIVKTVTSKSFEVEKESTRIDAPNLLPQDLTMLERNTKFDVLDLRERQQASSLSKSINIPFVELPFRAAVELDRAKLQIVDCTNLLWDECDSAVQTLKKLRFNAATLGAGTYHARCKVTPLSG